MYMYMRVNAIPSTRPTPLPTATTPLPIWSIIKQRGFVFFLTKISEGSWVSSAGGPVHTREPSGGPVHGHKRSNGASRISRTRHVPSGSPRVAKN